MGGVGGSRAGRDGGGAECADGLGSGGGGANGDGALRLGPEGETGAGLAMGHQADNECQSLSQPQSQSQSQSSCVVMWGDAHAEGTTPPSPRDHLHCDGSGSGAKSDNDGAAHDSTATRPGAVADSKSPCRYFLSESAAMGPAGAPGATSPSPTPSPSPRTSRPASPALPETPPLEYLCKAVVHHLGDSLAAGHFVADVRESAGGLWSRYDDSRVAPISTQEVIAPSHTCFLAFFVNQSCAF